MLRKRNKKNDIKKEIYNREASFSVKIDVSWMCVFDMRAITIKQGDIHMFESKDTT